MIFKNARTRLPFEGVASFIMLCRRDATEILSIRFFYVSSSSWNLYDLLVDFCEYQGIHTPRSIHAQRFAARSVYLFCFYSQGA